MRLDASRRWLIGLAIGILAAPLTLLSNASAEEAAKAEKPAKAEMSVKAQPAAATPSGLKADLLQWMTDAEEKLLELAEATPEEKYAWRPAEGVRSQGEVFLHVAAANFGIPNFWGVKPPEGFAFEGYEASLTKKADIQAALKMSFAHAKKSLQDLPEADFDKPVTIFGNEATVRWGYLLVLSHQHEHLGQSIAYARSNGIVPPWTARQNADIEAQRRKAEGEK